MHTLLSKDMTEMEDMSVTTKSSVAMYIIGPLTYPLLLAVSDMLSTNSKAVQLP